MDYLLSSEVSNTLGTYMQYGESNTLGTYMQYGESELKRRVCLNCWTVLVQTVADYLGGWIATAIVVTVGYFNTYIFFPQRAPAIPGVSLLLLKIRQELCTQSQPTHREGEKMEVDQRMW